jgi:hypothetical protein
MIGWFIVPYKRNTRLPFPVRRPAIDEFTETIAAENGQWSETEILGDKAIVKVRASSEMLATLAIQPGFIRLPKNSLNEPLSDLSNAQKIALRDLVLDCGYSLAELQIALGNDLGQRTLKDVLKFLTRRRLKPRYDSQSDSIILDGPTQPCKPIELLDMEVF